MPKILIQFAHPAYGRSRVQRALVKHTRNIEDITFNDLYEQYPDLYIDVKREQELLLEHDIIVFQHPFYWYSGPAIIKQWIDLVLEHGWAYGHNGTALTGKKMISALSCGGVEETYKNDGIHRYPLMDFLLPFRQTANLCNMEYLPPFVIHGANKIPPDEVEKFATQYAAILKGLADGSINATAYSDIEYMHELNIPA